MRNGFTFTEARELYLHRSADFLDWLATIRANEFNERYERSVDASIGSSITYKLKDAKQLRENSLDNMRRLMLYAEEEDDAQPYADNPQWDANFGALFGRDGEDDPLRVPMQDAPAKPVTKRKPK